MFIWNLASRRLLRRGIFLWLSVVAPSAAIAEVAVYEGTLEVVETSGALCGNNEKRVYRVDVVVDRNGGGIEGYFRGRDVATGHFTGPYLGNLKVSYPYDDAALAEGHLLSLQRTAQGLSGDLREKHLAATEDNCSFDLASLNLKEGSGQDRDTAWKQSAALWQIELLNRRTFLLTTSGRYREALQAAQQSLDLCERHFGPDSAETSIPLSNLAVVYRSLGRFAEAEPLCKRVLATAEKTLGPEHPTVAIRLMNLAELFEATGRNRDAEPLYQRALTISVKAFGADHPDVAKVLNNLAVLYQNQGRYQEAEPLYQRAIAIMTRIYGAGHPSVKVMTRNLDDMRKKHPSTKSVI